MTVPGAAERPPAYRRPVPRFWWLEKRSYLLFTLRELSSAFVAWSVVFLLLMLHAVSRGETAFQDFVDWASSWWVVVLNVVTMVFLLLHTVTWFDLTPKAMAARLGGRELPGSLVIAAQYVALLVVSVFVSWLVTR